MRQAEKLNLTKEKYLPYCSFYHETGMPEEMKRLVMSIEYKYGGITETECFGCELKEVYYYLPKLTEEEKKRYVELVWGTLNDEEKEFCPEWRIEEDLYVLYYCHDCGAWFVDERWSDGH